MALAKSFEFDARPGCLSVFAHKVCHLVHRVGLFNMASVVEIIELFKCTLCGRR